MAEDPVIVIGAGIAGLTAAALLAREGIPVTLLEAHHQPGGCAGTFRRGSYVFDVGATQVAGLQPGGSHERLFRHLQLPPPAAELLNPGCVVDLADGSQPIHLWHDPIHWREERQRQFPGSESFWELCGALHRSNWAFASRDPVLPPRNLWDLNQLLKAIGPRTLGSGLLSGLSVADLLRLCRCGDDPRLRRFLDLQIKLYSQEPLEQTAALYGATVLQMAQAPLGLWHLNGSMQIISDLLVKSLHRDGGHLRLRQRAVRLQGNPQGSLWHVDVQTAAGTTERLSAADVICSLPPQCLPRLISAADERSGAYLRQLSKLPKPNGALVFYGATDRAALPNQCPVHLQFDSGEAGSLFITISCEGDGRAPAGQATVIASMFTPTADWCSLIEPAYQQKKEAAFVAIRAALQTALRLPSSHQWCHQELATPRGFAAWTGRPEGIVGGLGQHPRRFGPFGLASRTPLPGLWLCGDSIHPGEGTAGVSVSALMACRQLMARRGHDLRLAS
ncbi:MAG: C-3',4' desaturase CrtD [Prochlorococcus sp.]